MQFGTSPSAVMFISCDPFVVVHSMAMVPPADPLGRLEAPGWSPSYRAIGFVSRVSADEMVSSSMMGPFGSSAGGFLDQLVSIREAIPDSELGQSTALGVLHNLGIA